MTQALSKRRNRKSGLTDFAYSFALCLLLVFAIPVCVQSQDRKADDIAHCSQRHFFVAVLVTDLALQHELELSDEQIADLRDAVSVASERLRTAAKVAEKREIYRAFESSFESILLKHQYKRLTQLLVQYELSMHKSNSDGFESVLLLADELELTPIEKAELKLRIEQQRAETISKRKALINRQRSEILSILTPEQRAEFASLVGEFKGE